MRKALALAVLAAVAAFAAGAWSAAPPSPAEKRLQKQLSTVQSQVKTLQRDVKKLKTQVTDAEAVGAASLLFGACSTAISADALQGTWQEVDQLATATQAGKTYFGPQTPVSDLVGGQSICQVLGAPRSQALPPSTAQFTALLSLLQRSAAFRLALHSP